MREARFLHATDPGWATYHDREYRGWRGLLCRFRGHRVPGHRPTMPNGHSPSCYSRCVRCDAPMKWYVRGQHRYGGMNAPTMKVSV